MALRLSLLRWPGSGGGSSSGETVVADNGTSIFGGAVILGQNTGQSGDPAMLLFPTEIPFNGQLLTFIDRTSGDHIYFQTTPLIINLVTNDSSFATPSQIVFQNTFSVLSITAATSIALGGDYFQFEGDNGGFFILNSGNTAFTTGIPSSDLGYLLQIYGGQIIENTAGGTNSFVINPTVDINGNSVQHTVDVNGISTITSTYAGSNGGMFRGAFMLIQQANYTNGGEKQTLFSTNYNINWSPLGSFTNFTEIALNEFQVQNNIAGDGSSQISVNSSASLYNANVWSYMGFNGEGATNNLSIISSSTIYDRPTAYGAFVNRMDFNNNPNVNVSSSGSLGLAAFYSDFCIGFSGSLDVMNDFLAGGMSDLTSNNGSFVLGTRYGFRVLDLTSNVSVTKGYAFYSEGVNDISYIAGHLIIGGANPPVINAANLQIFGTEQISDAGGSGDFISFSVPDPVVSLFVNDVNWIARDVEFGLHNNNTDFIQLGIDATVAGFGVLTGDIGMFTFATAGQDTHLVFTNLGSIIMVRAADRVTVTDTANMLAQVNGNLSTKESSTEDGAIFIGSPDTSVAGSVSGTADFTMSLQGSANKEVIIFLTALVGTATFNFPTAFTNLPGIVTTFGGPAGGVVTAISTASVTVTGANDNGVLILKGF